MKAMSNGTKVLTLADLARRCGVSPVTVSRALSGNRLVAASTRERVLATASELGYSPNLLARALAQNRSSTLGVVIHEFSNPFYSPMVSAIENAAASRDLLVVLGESQRDPLLERRYVERFRQLRAAGIIITPATRGVRHLDALSSAGIPVVVLARQWKKGDFVTVDNVTGGRLAARHILERGHRRVGVVYSDNPENTAVQERVGGFRQTLKTGGVAVPADWDIRTPRTSFEDGQLAADRLLALSRRPSALFAVTDRMAMALIHHLLQHGVRVPEDIAVVGYDDMPYAMYSEIPLTSVAIPVRQMGEVSASILFERLDRGPGRRHHVLLPPSLVVRASCP